MYTLTGSEDPDEMPHDAAFHKGLHYLLRQKQNTEEEIQFLFWNYNLGPLYIYNGPSKVHCIKPEGRVHKCIKGLLISFFQIVLVVYSSTIQFSHFCLRWMQKNNSTTYKARLLDWKRDILLIILNKRIQLRYYSIWTFVTLFVPAHESTVSFIHFSNK